MSESTEFIVYLVVLAVSLFIGAVVRVIRPRPVARPVSTQGGCLRAFIIFGVIMFILTVVGFVVYFIAQANLY